MDSKDLFNGSVLNQLETINELRNSLQLSYPELESITYQYGISDPRIFPYLGTDSTPPMVSKYSSTVIDSINSPIKEDNVSSVLDVLATPIREDYVRLALNSLATPIRDDYLRLLMNSIARSIREDHLRLVFEALIRAIREDALRTALQKFNNNGIEAEPVVVQVSGVIKNNVEFIKYSPSQKFSLVGEEKMRYIELKDIGKDFGDIVTVLDRKMYEIPLKEKPKLEISDYDLYIHGSIGMDGTYEEMDINLDSVKHLYLPVYCEFSPTNEKVPRDYWITQARDILDRQGWSKKSIKDLSRDSFIPYKGKKPSNKVMSFMRHSLQKELKKRKN